MGLKSLFKKVVGIAPILAEAAINPVGAGIGLLGKMFGVPGGSTNAIETAMAADPNWQAKCKKIELENEAALKKDIAAIDRAEIDKFYDLEIAAIKSEDEYVRRARPSFTYAVKDCFKFQMFGIIIIALIGLILSSVTDKVEFKEVMDGLEALTAATFPIWGVALTVLGHNIGKRSQDKAVAQGHPPGGLLTTLIGAIRK